MSDAAFGESGAYARTYVDAKTAGAVCVAELRHTHSDEATVVDDGLCDVINVAVSGFIAVRLHGD
jgi:hypothetical protein